MSTNKLDFIKTTLLLATWKLKTKISWPILVPVDPVKLDTPVSV